jgi:HEAT repeat protein
MTMKTHFSKILVAVVISALAGTASAGRGGSAAKIQNAINSNSQDAIIAELERAERLVCDACIPSVMDLLDDDRYEVREAAAWWFGRRASLKKQLTERSLGDLEGADSRLARNAADVLGTFRQVESVPALNAAMARTDLSTEARVAIARALGTIGSKQGMTGLTMAMSDGDAEVRLAALSAWINVRRVGGAAPAVALVDDGDARVRAKAAAVLGETREASGRAALEAQLSGDADPVVRRNAAWALGRIGDPASRAALEAAENDESSLVRMTAHAAKYQLR